jgi:arsenite-transporting ATPase
MVLVTRPQTSAITEVARTFAELTAIGFVNQHLVVNGVLPAEATQESLGQHLAERQRAALAELPGSLARLPRSDIALKAQAMVGLDALSRLFEAGPAPTKVESTPVAPAVAVGLGKASASADAVTELDALIDDIAATENGLILCMGKGGVGKTTIAAAIAVGLVARGHDVHLTTTDPAAHLGETLPTEVEGLQVSRIDPVAATQAYRDHVMATKGKNLDEAGRATLLEDLRSPCTEEVAVFGQFSQAVAESRRRFVVIDTAPTGRTLLLLDAAGSYHREIARQLGDSGTYTTPLMRLQDPAQTKVVLVTLAEPTPVSEALGLASDLRRALITPWAWVVNNSLAAADPQGPFLRQRAAAEAPQIERVAAETTRLAVVPALPFEPVGQDSLRQLATGDRYSMLGSPAHT